MTGTELTAILDRLDSFGPQQRLNGKRAQLISVRERLLALHTRGHRHRDFFTIDPLHEAESLRILHSAGWKIETDNNLIRQACGSCGRYGQANEE